MNDNDLVELLGKIGKRYRRFNLSILIPEQPSEDDIDGEIQGLRSLGYHVFFRSSAFGKEIVVTDKCEN